MMLWPLWLCGQRLTWNRAGLRTYALEQVGTLWPAGPSWPATCLHTARELRMVLHF